MKSLRYNIKVEDMKMIRNEVISNIENYYAERDSLFEDDECYLFSEIPLENLIADREDDEYFLIKGSYDEEGIPEYGNYISRRNMFSFVEEWMYSGEKIKELVIMFYLIKTSLGWSDYEFDVTSVMILNYINFVREKVDEGNINTIPIAI
jgi:hypothetical protein